MEFLDLGLELLGNAIVRIINKLFDFHARLRHGGQQLLGLFVAIAFAVVLLAAILFLSSMLSS